MIYKLLVQARLEDSILLLQHGNTEDATQFLQEALDAVKKESLTPV